MILYIHSDASYLSGKKANNRVCWDIFIWTMKNEDPSLEHHWSHHTLKAIMDSTAEEAML
eukprot:7362410-Ditylum_brightwellii.AAC.1